MTQSSYSKKVTIRSCPPKKIWHKIFFNIGAIILWPLLSHLQSFLIIFYMSNQLLMNKRYISNSFSLHVIMLRYLDDIEAFKLTCIIEPCWIKSFLVCGPLIFKLNLSRFHPHIFSPFLESVTVNMFFRCLSHLRVHQQK